MWNIFKVWCRSDVHIVNVKHISHLFFSVSIGDFEQENVSWVLCSYQSFIFFGINDYNYQIFCRCWDEDPSIRPSFTEILQYVEKYTKERVSLNPKFYYKLIWDRVYKNGPSKNCRRGSMVFFKVCLPQILLSPFLNTFSHLKLLPFWNSWLIIQKFQNNLSFGPEKCKHEFN